jgi:hypothetical protein
MWVGKEYTVEQFVEEALAIGVSKRIPAVPKSLKIGDPLYLVHSQAMPDEDEKNILRTLFPDEVRKDRAGIFMVACVTAFHRILTEEQAKDEDFVKELEEQGLTPVLEIDDPFAYHPAPPIQRCIEEWVA